IHFLEIHALVRRSDVDLRRRIRRAVDWRRQRFQPAVRQVMPWNIGRLPRPYVMGGKIACKVCKFPADWDAPRCKPPQRMSFLNFLNRTAPVMPTTLVTPPFVLNHHVADQLVRSLSSASVMPSTWPRIGHCERGMVIEVFAPCAR